MFYLPYISIITYVLVLPTLFISNIIMYFEIKNILNIARNKVYKTANFVMVEAYWNIGKSIIEEQGGNEKAEYGAGLIKELSKQMTQDFGKGFTVTNLKYMRQFYLMFPNAKKKVKILTLLTIAHMQHKF